MRYKIGHSSPKNAKPTDHQSKVWSPLASGISNDDLITSDGNGSPLSSPTDFVVLGRQNFPLQEWKRRTSPFVIGASSELSKAKQNSSMYSCNPTQSICFTDHEIVNKRRRFI